MKTWAIESIHSISFANSFEGLFFLYHTYTCKRIFFYKVLRFKIYNLCSPSSRCVYWKARRDSHSYIYANPNCDLALIVVKLKLGDWGCWQIKAGINGNEWNGCLPLLQFRRENTMRLLLLRFMIRMYGSWLQRNQHEHFGNIVKLAVSFACHSFAHNYDIVMQNELGQRSPDLL